MKIPINVTFKCDICGADGVGWKRRSYRITKNNQIRLHPVSEPSTKLCAEHFKTIELENIHLNYTECEKWLQDEFDSY